MELFRNGLTNEILFYGGIILAGCTLLTGFIYLCISHIQKIRLDAQLDAEYGIKKKRTNK